MWHNFQPWNLKSAIPTLVHDTTNIGISYNDTNIGNLTYQYWYTKYTYQCWKINYPTLETSQNSQPCLIADQYWDTIEIPMLETIIPALETLYKLPTLVTVSQYWNNI